MTPTPPFRHNAQRRTFFVLCCVVALHLFCLPACAQAPIEQVISTPARSYHALRYEEDWSFLRNPALRSDPLDTLKFRALHAQPSFAYLSFGGEIRQTIERVLHDNWSTTAPTTQAFALERMQLHADLHLHPRMRFFLQFESGLEQGRSGGPRIIDLKRLDFLNAFAEFTLPADRLPAHLRLGRQELQLGSGRFIAVREGPNVRQSFYGARISTPVAGWQTDWFALRPAADHPGFFDNVPLQTTTFFGAYATRPWHAQSRNLLDVYLYSLDRKHVSFDRGAGRELRQTLGARIASRDPASIADRLAIPHFDLESAWQFGSFAGSPIRAWTVATETGVILPALPFSPRIGLRSNIASGDGHSSAALGTFNPLFPIGNYFGILTDTGPGPLNSMDLHPNLRLFLPHAVALNADWLFWWRHSLHDGVYGVPGNLLIPAQQNTARFVGHRPGIEARWQIDRHTYLQADYGVFFSGPFVRQSRPGVNLNYASFWLGYKF